MLLILLYCVYIVLRYYIIINITITCTSIWTRNSRKWICEHTDIKCTEKEDK